MNLTCRVDAIHLRHRDVHDNDVWLQDGGLSDRFDATYGFAHDLEFRTFAEQFAQTGACYMVVIGDKNPQRLRRARRGVINHTFSRSDDVTVLCFCNVGGYTGQGRARHSQGEAGALSWSALDVQMTAKQSKALLNAEQPQTSLLLIRVVERGARIKPDAVIAHLDMNGVTASECELDIDPVHAGVLDCVEQQFADALEEQDASVTCVGIGLRVGGDIHENAVLLLCSSCQPCQGGGQATDMQDRRKEIHTQRTCGLHRFLDVSTCPSE